MLAAAVGLLGGLPTERSLLPANIFNANAGTAQSKNSAAPAQQNNGGRGQNHNGGQGQNNNNGGRGQSNNNGAPGQQNNGGRGQNNIASQGQNHNGGRGQNNNGGQGQNQNGGRGQNNNGGQGQNQNGGRGQNNIAAQGQNHNGGQGQNHNGGQGQNNNGGRGQNTNNGAPGQQNNGGRGQNNNGGSGQRSSSPVQTKNAASAQAEPNFDDCPSGATDEAKECRKAVRVAAREAAEKSSPETKLAKEDSAEPNFDDCPSGATDEAKECRKAVRVAARRAAEKSSPEPKPAQEDSAVPNFDDCPSGATDEAKECRKAARVAARRAAVKSNTQPAGQQGNTTQIPGKDWPKQTLQCSGAEMENGGCWPRLFLIGAMKAGTTSLFTALRNEGLVCGMSDECANSTEHGSHGNNKEMHAISAPEEKWKTLHNHPEKYTSCFRPSNCPSRHFIDATPDYIMEAEGPTRITHWIPKEWLPELRLVVVVREPVGRALSQFNMAIEMDIFPFCEAEYEGPSPLRRLTDMPSFAKEAQCDMVRVNKCFAEVKMMRSKVSAKSVPKRSGNLMDAKGSGNHMDGCPPTGCQANDATRERVQVLDRKDPDAQAQSGDAPSTAVDETAAAGTATGTATSGTDVTGKGSGAPDWRLKPCESWCVDNSDTWTTKCSWPTKCGGCDDCADFNAAKKLDWIKAHGGTAPPGGTIPDTAGEAADKEEEEEKEPKKEGLSAIVGSSPGVQSCKPWCEDRRKELEAMGKRAAMCEWDQCIGCDSCTGATAAQEEPEDKTTGEGGDDEEMEEEDLAQDDDEEAVAAGMDSGAYQHCLNSAAQPGVPNRDHINSYSMLLRGMYDPQIKLWHQHRPINRKQVFVVSMDVLVGNTKHNMQRLTEFMGVGDWTGGVHLPHANRATSHTTGERAEYLEFKIPCATRDALETFFSPWNEQLRQTLRNDRKSGRAPTQEPPFEGFKSQVECYDGPAP